MITKLPVLVFVAAIICFGGVSVKTRGDFQPGTSSGQEAESNSQWVARCLKEMETIKPGMTRREMLRVFGPEGGLSTALRRTYVYRQCPYFKVDVEFKPIGRPERDREGRVTAIESDDDVIRKISKPYIGWSVSD
jgi:hypothetical protein